MIKARLSASVELSGLTAEQRASVQAMFRLPNPAYARHKFLQKAEKDDHVALKADGVSTRLMYAFADDPPEFVELWADGPNGTLIVPRGRALRECRTVLGTGFSVADVRASGTPLRASLMPGVEPRDYQTEAIQALLGGQQGTLHAGTGAGKTFSGLVAAVAAGRSALVTVHTSLIQKGWLAEILGDEARDKRPVLDIDPDTVQLVRGTKDAVAKARKAKHGICIAMVQTLGRLAPDHDFWRVANDTFGTLIHDEGHHAAANTWVYLNELLAQRFRWNLTATPERKDGMGFLLDYTVGPILYRVDDEMLMQRGFIQRPTVQFVHTEYYPNYKSHDFSGDLVDDVQKNIRVAKSKFSRNDLLGNMIEHEGRNRQICDWMEYDWKRGAQQAAVTQRVEHTHRLAAMLRERGMVVEPLIGDVSEKRRDEIVRGVAQGRIDAIIGTSVLDEGLDIPNLSAIHLTCPSSNQGKLSQQVGRCRRPSPLPCVVRDYVDKRLDATKNSYQTRRRLYREMGWLLEGDLRSGVQVPPDQDESRIMLYAA